MARLALAALLSLAINTEAAASPLPMRVWQLQDYNMDHIKRVIDMAAKQRVNRIQISHQIVMFVEQPIDNAQLARDINTICEWAHEKGILVDLWTHELHGITEELSDNDRANLDDPRLWKFVRGKYEKLFAICPGIDGLVLSMHETAMSIYHDTRVASSASPEQRVANLIDNLGEVCKTHNKELFVRTFAYEPSELEYIQKGIGLCKSDVVVMSKCVPHDWQPFYPVNPVIGNVGGRPQVVEYDLGHEFGGLATIPYINIDYCKRHLDYGISKNIIGAVIRIERLKWRAVDTPNQATIDIFTKMLLRPDVDPHKLYKNWLEDRYGKEALPYLFSAFMRTEEIVDKAYFVLGYWVTDHSRIPRYEYAVGSLRRRTTAKWDPSTKHIEQELFNPTSATIRKIAKEKDFALELLDQSISDIEKARPFLKPGDYEYFADLFQREKAMVIVWKEAMNVVFGIEVYKATKSNSDAKFLAASADRLEKVTEQNRTHLINMAADYANPQSTRNVDAAIRLIELARATLQEN